MPHSLHFAFFPTHSGTLCLPIAHGDTAVLEAMLALLCTRWADGPVSGIAARIRNARVCGCDRPFLTVTHDLDAVDGVRVVVHSQAVVDSDTLADGMAEVLHLASYLWRDNPDTRAMVCRNGAMGALPAEAVSVVVDLLLQPHPEFRPAPTCDN